MNNSTNAAVNARRGKEQLEQSTGPMSPGQLTMEEDLGLDPSANLPARPEERRPHANPDNSACSSMEHHDHRRQ